jgi:hypothetical protein
MINNTAVPLFFLKNTSKDVNSTPDNHEGFDITLPFPG